VLRLIAKKMCVLVVYVCHNEGTPHMYRVMIIVPYLVDFHVL
jgi:hypothetical protein